MIKIDEAIIVEGKYDKIKLSSIVDAVIIITNGFGIFKDTEKLELIRYYAKKTGIIILTDSDAAGCRIRGYIKGAVGSGKITNVYIPDVFGKEKRKVKPSAEAATRIYMALYRP
jgi:ribonuclease M5